MPTIKLKADSIDCELLKLAIRSQINCYTNAIKQSGPFHDRAKLVCDYDGKVARLENILKQL